MITPLTRGYDEGFPKPYVNKKYYLVKDVRAASEIDDHIGGQGIDDEMEQFFGTQVTVTGVYSDTFNIAEDNGEYDWNLIWLDGFCDLDFMKHPEPKIKVGDKVRLTACQSNAMYIASKRGIDIEFDDVNWTRYYGKIVTVSEVFKGDGSDTCFCIEGEDEDMYFMARFIERSHNVKIDSDGNLV